MGIRLNLVIEYQATQYYSIERNGENCGKQRPYFCFTHAVQRAIRGEMIEVAVEGQDDVDFRNTSCIDCEMTQGYLTHPRRIVAGPFEKGD